MLHKNPITIHFYGEWATHFFFFSPQKNCKLRLVLTKESVFISIVLGRYEVWNIKKSPWHNIFVFWSGMGLNIHTKYFKNLSWAWTLVFVETMFYVVFVFVLELLFLFVSLDPEAIQFCHFINDTDFWCTKFNWSLSL